MLVYAKRFVYVILRCNVNSHFDRIIRVEISCSSRKRKQCQYRILQCKPSRAHCCLRYNSIYVGMQLLESIDIRRIRPFARSTTKRHKPRLLFFFSPDKPKLHKQPSVCSSGGRDIDIAVYIAVRKTKSTCRLEIV